MQILWYKVWVWTVKLVNCLLIAATLTAKNEEKMSAVRLVAGGGGLSRVLKVGKSFRVSVVL